MGSKKLIVAAITIILLSVVAYSDEPAEDVESFREYCLSLKGVTEEFPFDDVTLVFKVMRKLFALTGLDKSFRINLKCDPELAVVLREHFPCVIPGYHMNKKHWITIVLTGEISESMLIDLANGSYSLVVSKLTKAKKQELEQI